MSDIRITNYGCRSFVKNEKWNPNSMPVNRLYYIVSGEGFYKHNGEKKRFIPGCIYIIPQNFERSFSWNEDVGFKHMYFDFFYSKVFALNKPIYFKADEDNTIEQIILFLEDFLKKCSDGIYNKFDFKKGITGCFTMLLSLIEKTHSIEFVEDNRIEKVFTFIHKNYSKDISVDDMAKLVYLNKSYFSKLFKDSTGMTPHEYLKNYRITKGIEMINNNVSVSEAAERTGYKSPNAFSAAVKSSTGMSPKQNAKEFAE